MFRLLLIMLVVSILGCTENVPPHSSDNIKNADLKKVANEENPILNVQVEQPVIEKLKLKKKIPRKTTKYRISGPYHCDNLSVFLVHGDDKISGNILTLQEAMEQNKVIVHETERVNQLMVENTSFEESIYIQAGDMLKGGRQDRAAGLDLIIRPASGKVPMKSFCVEAGRWRQRAGENVHSFSRSTDQVATKRLKMAIRHKNNQSAVWANVAKTQKKLGDNLNSSVQSENSASSMQLTMENQKVRQNVKEYTEKLKDLTKQSSDTIGYVFAVNGKINSADIYASHALFCKLWSKLLKSSAVEAIAEKQEETIDALVSVEQVESWLAEAQTGKTSMQKINDNSRLVNRRTDRIVFQETIWEAELEELSEECEEQEVSIHENYMSDDGEMEEMEEMYGEETDQEEETCIIWDDEQFE